MADADVYQFLQNLLMMQESFDTPETPFRHSREAAFGRSINSGDLTPSDLDAITVLASRTIDLALKRDCLISFG